MKWLIYGGRGWIGGMIVKELESKKETVLVSRARVDDEVDLEQEIVAHDPDRIVCCVGRTHGPGYSTIDYLEQKDKLTDNIRDNLYGPIILAILCEKHNVHLTYLGTGCIFNDVFTKHRYHENDKPDFFGSRYSIVKGFTDRLLHQYGSTVLNARIRMPIVGYHHQRNFITKIVRYEKICSIQNSMTVLPDLIPVLIDLASTRKTGTINLTNPGTIEHNEILGMYKKHVDPSLTWKNFSAEEQNKILLSERSNNHLDTGRLQALYPDVLPIRESIERLLKSWENY